MAFSEQDTILIKSSYLKAYTAKRLTDEFPEKSWTKRGVKNLLKKSCGTHRHIVERRPGSGRPRSARTEVVSQEDKLQTRMPHREISRETGIRRCLCHGLFLSTCVWNFSRGDVHRSWHARTALLAWSALSFCFRSSRSMPLTLSSFQTKGVLGRFTWQSSEPVTQGSAALPLIHTYAWMLRIGADRERTKFIV